MAQDFSPTNTIEVSLQQAMAGKIAMPEFLAELVKSTLYMPSVNEPNEDGSNFVPLVFEKEGKSLAAVFTNLALLDTYKNQIKGNIAMNAGQLLARSAPGYGVVINPGYSLGLEIQEHGIKNIVSQFVTGATDA